MHYITATFRKKKNLLSHRHLYYFRTDLVDGLGGLDLDLGGGGVDGVGDVRLEGDEETPPVGHSLAEAVVEVGVLVDDAVVPRRPVQVDKGRPEGRDET